MREVFGEARYRAEHSHFRAVTSQGSWVSHEKSLLHGGQRALWACSWRTAASKRLNLSLRTKGRPTHEVSLSGKRALLGGRFLKHVQSQLHHLEPTLQGNFNRFSQGAHLLSPSLGMSSSVPSPSPEAVVSCGPMFGLHLTSLIGQ